MNKMLKLMKQRKERNFYLEGLRENYCKIFNKAFPIGKFLLLMEKEIVDEKEQFSACWSRGRIFISKPGENAIIKCEIKHGKIASYLYSPLGFEPIRAFGESESSCIPLGYKLRAVELVKHVLNTGPNSMKLFSQS